MERSLQRIEAAAQLNAVVRLRPDEALAEARALDSDLARAGHVPGPLGGLPLLVKEIEDVAGLPTTRGSLLRSAAPPARRDGLVPRRLRAAGAIVVGKTNTPEFAFEGYTANRLFGATLNPWAPDWSPGGSSGGSGAALAAGLAPLATATDGGGSIRIPAAACGLAGLKPTNGVIGRDPVPSWIDLSTDGPLASTIADLRLLLALEAGPVAGDPTAQVGWRLGPGALPRRLIAAERLVAGPPLDPGSAALFRAALDRLGGDLGLPIETAEPDAILRAGDADADWFTIAAAESLGELGRPTVEAALAEERLEPGFGRWMELALAIPIDAYLAARRRRLGYTRDLDSLLGADAILVTPTLTVPGWSPWGVVPGREAEGPGLPLDVLNTGPQNLAGHPALSVPAGRHANGVPFGLQLTGPRYREDLVLGLGAAWEAIRPWALTADGFAPFAI